MLNAPNPAPSPIMMRIGTQPCMFSVNQQRLVNVFSSRSQKKARRHPTRLQGPGASVRAILSTEMLSQERPGSRFRSRFFTVEGLFEP